MEALNDAERRLNDAARRWDGAVRCWDGAVRQQDGARRHWDGVGIDENKAGYTAQDAPIMRTFHLPE